MENESNLNKMEENTSNRIYEYILFADYTIIIEF